MKRLITLTLTLFGIFMLVLSCQKPPFLSMTGPRSLSFSRDGGMQTIAFSCNRDWSVLSSDSWVRVSPSSGSAADGDITVTLTVSPNTSYDSRTTSLTIKAEDLSETVSINQDMGIGLIVSPTDFDLTNAEQTIEIEVQKNVNYSITIDEGCKDWIKQSGTRALTTDKVLFNIAKNEAYDEREGKIVFSQKDGNLTQTVTIKQSQANGLFITTPNYDLSNDSHTLSVEVKANVEFQVTSQADWIKFIETRALKTSTIVLSIEANKTYDNRTGTVLVKQTNGDLTGIITIHQKQTDGLLVTPTSFDLSNQEQIVEIDVKNNFPFRVVIPDDAKNWISLQSNTQTRALVNDKVVLSVSQNTSYDNREAAVTLKQVDGSLAETVKIKQAYGEGLLIEKTEYEVSNQAQTLCVEVKANVDFEVISEFEWINYIETRALSGAEVWLSIDKNDSFDRTGSVIIKTSNLSILVSVIQKGATIEFEDALFKKYCVENFDKDGDGEVSLTEAEEVDMINVNGGDITSLVGIKCFNNLTYINCASEKITSLDLSGCSSLESLSCSHNNLSFLNLSGCTALRYIDCQNNKLPTLDVGGFSKLTFLGCENNKLTNLNIEGCSALELISCVDNRLSVLDVSDCSSLEALNCRFNQLSDLTVKNCSKLVTLFCNDNYLSCLDLSGCSSLKVLEMYNNKVSCLNISECFAIQDLMCNGNQLSSLDLRHCPFLEHLDCYGNQLVTLDVNGCSELEKLFCYGNLLTELIINKCPSLQDINCGQNQFTILDVSEIGDLRSLYCTGCPYLKEIWLHEGQSIYTFVYDSDISTIKYKKNN